ncbi:MAG: tetratricopeptide repeat protein [Planctomycetales bacterium]|nr:tetratricopeptide repeat protein [Planctomycetales bacterium]
MRFTTAFGLVAIIGLACGCQSGVRMPRLPFAQKASKAVGIDRVFKNDYEQLADAHADRTIVTPMTQEKPSFWRRLLPGNKSKVVATDDPVLLSTKTKGVGPEVHIEAAKLHEQRGDLPAAASSYARALQIDPKHEAALLSFARLYDRHDRFEEANKLYVQAVEHHPESARSHNDYGLCLVRQGDTPTGLRELARAVELSPGELRYRNNIAQVLVGAGRIEDALEHLRHVHTDAIAHYNVAHWLQSDGNMDAALSHYVKSAELDPNFVPATTMVAQLQTQQFTTPDAAPYQTLYGQQTP